MCKNKNIFYQSRDFITFYLYTMYNKQFELYYLYQKSKIIYNLYNKNFNKYISKNKYVTQFNMTSK